MQIEGLWYYLLCGVLGAGTLHYAIAKIFGPLLFGRGWCGYACWTAMILDLLPYQKPQSPRRNWGFIRYIMFGLSLAIVLLLFWLGKADAYTMFMLFVAGNIFYYAVGITLAILLKDNRAFCKYICPITVFLKPMSYYALIRIKCDEDKCINGKQKRPQSQECHGVHPLSEVYESLSDQGFVNLRIRHRRCRRLCRQCRRMALGNFDATS